MENILLTPKDLDALYKSNPHYENSPEAWEQSICRIQTEHIIQCIKEYWDSGENEFGYSGDCAIRQLIEKLQEVLQTEIKQQQCDS
jgi:predicted Zn-dependent peptidase